MHTHDELPWPRPAIKYNPGHLTHLPPPRGKLVYPSEDPSYTIYQPIKCWPEQCQYACSPFNVREKGLPVPACLPACPLPLPACVGF